MPPVIVIEDQPDGRAIRDAIQALQAGHTVGLPGTTGYHSARLHQDGDDAPVFLEKPARLAFGQTNHAIARIPQSSPRLLRLVERCWPGPLAVQVNGLSLTVPSHPVLLNVLAEARSLWISTDHQRVITSAAELAKLEPGIEMVLDAGPARYDRACSVVGVSDSGFELVHQGILSEKAIRVSACEIYLFVCTGNTCRSPLAEGMFRKLLSERLDCGLDDLLDHGYVVQSAGLAAASGAKASPESVQLLSAQGVDIGGHASQPVTPQLLDACNYIFTMTNGHRDAILRYRPDLSDRVEVLRRDGADVVDPIGGGMSEYQRCETEIEDSLRAIIGSHIEKGSN